MALDRWTREQTIVALRTYFVVPFNRASNNQVDIVRIAALIGRKPSAVKMKIGNFGSLDPELAKHGIVGLSGTSELDREIWNEFANDREKLALESDRLIREFGNEPAEAERANTDTERVGSDILRLTKTRANQDFFRERVIGLYEKTCCITGIQVPELLIASHIVPWSKDELNRLNPENGLCLNALHDKAFDTGLMTVTTDYRVKLSKRLFKEKTSDVLGKFLLAYEDQRILLPERYHPKAEFLEYHNEMIFQK